MPERSPLRHSCCRERDQYTARPSATLSAKACRFIHAKVSTAPSASCATAGTSPSAFQWTLSQKSGLAWELSTVFMSRSSDTMVE